MIITVRLDPRCAEDPNLDTSDLYRTNYEGDEARHRPRHEGRADGGADRP